MKTSACHVDALLFMALVFLGGCAPHPGYPKSWPSLTQSCAPLDGYYSGVEFGPHDPNGLTHVDVPPLDLFFSEEQVRDLTYGYYPAAISDVRISTTAEGLTASAMDRGTVVFSATLPATCDAGTLQIKIQKTRRTQNGEEKYEESYDVASDGSLALHTHYSHFMVLLILPIIDSADYWSLWRRSDSPKLPARNWPKALPVPVATVKEPTQVKGVVVDLRCSFHCLLTIRTNDGQELTGLCDANDCRNAGAIEGRHLFATIGTIRSFLGLPGSPFGLANVFYSVGEDKNAE